MGIGTDRTLFTMHIEFTWFLFRMVRGQLLGIIEVGDLEMVDGSRGVGEMCWGGEITGEKLDGAEGMRGIGVSWINRGED